MASSLRDGDKWEQVGVKVVTAGATGAAVGLGLAVLLFGGVRSRSACMSVCTGAGLGHGLILGKGTFEDAREHLPAQLSQGPPPPPALTRFIPCCSPAGLSGGLPATLPALALSNSAAVTPT